MTDIENTSFTEEYENNLKLIKNNFKLISIYSCPCKRKKMTDEDWKNYKNEHLSNIWKCLHDLSFSFLINPNENSQQLMFNLLTIELTKIPCSTCRVHYKTYLKNFNHLEDICKNKFLLITWMIDLHNDVNKRLNKKELTYEEVFEYYKFNYNSCKTDWA